MLTSSLRSCPQILFDLDLRSIQIQASEIKRYINDIFACCLDPWCTRIREALERFLSSLNQYRSTFKFTASWSTELVVFLDTRVYIRDGHLKMDLHVKPTDTHQYLHINSCHPRHCKTAIPYSVALRVRRICSDEDNLSKRMNDLKQHLRQRGYPEHLLDSEIQRATNTPRDATLRSCTRDKTTRIPLVVT